MQQPTRTKAYDQLQSLLARRILILDGAMGTMIQALGLSEEQVRGDRFQAHHKDLARFSDLLCLTRPDDVTAIHRAYFEAGADIVEAGVDLLLPETVIDTLNLKACLCAIEKYFQETGRRLPVIVSGTFDKGGATFVSGQSVAAFWNAVSHVPLLAVGMNCALGPDLMRPHVEELSSVATT